MTGFNNKSLLLACMAGLALGGCFGGDSTSDLASPGNTGSNPGTPGGGDGGGGNPGGPSAGDCPTGTTAVDVGTQKHCRLSGVLTQDVTLVAGNIYQLEGNVLVGRDVGARGDASNGLGVTLTIQPGVTVYGLPRAQLAVQRGSKLIANGTASSPIIFTSAQDMGFSNVLSEIPAGARRAPHTGFVTEDPYSGEWGGVQLLGRARLNTCVAPAVCEEESEGDAGRYGGNLDTDNSGSMRFVQIRYAGFQITTENELNSLALWGVGSGTTVENIQIHNGGDDNIEFFGGTVNVKRIVLTGAGDDSFDWTYGWRGKAQFVLVIQNPARADTDRGIEADNYGPNNDASPRSNPTISNLTLIGRGTAPGTHAMTLRVGTAAQVYNTVIGGGWPGQGITVDGGVSQGLLGQSGGINLRSVYNSANNPFGPSAFSGTLSGYFLTPGLNNAVGASTLAAYGSGAAPAYVNGANENAVTYYDVTTLDGFFEPVTYVGAVGSRATNWTVGWTFGLN